MTLSAVVQCLEPETLNQKLPLPSGLSVHFAYIIMFPKVRGSIPHGGSFFPSHIYRVFFILGETIDKNYENI